MPRCPEMTPAELRVMKALWQLNRGSVADVRAELQVRGHDLAYTTVMTLLGRLAAKNAVQVDKAREPFVYRPAHRRESVLRDRLRDFVRDVFDGQAESLVLNLVENESLSREELRAIEKRIAASELRTSDVRTPDGRVSDGRVSDGRVPDGRVSDGRVSDGRVSDGRASDTASESRPRRRKERR